MSAPPGDDVAELSPEQAEELFGARKACFMRDVMVAARAHGIQTAVIVYEDGEGVVGGFSCGADELTRLAAQRVTVDAQMSLVLLLSPDAGPNGGH